MVISTSIYSRHELKLIAGGFCSLHYHEHRANRFNLLSGVVEIVEMYGPLFCRRFLTPNNIYDVPSCVPHMFLVYKPGEMVEEYYADRGGVVRDDDIIRIFEGNFTAVDELKELPQKLVTDLFVIRG